MSKDKKITNQILNFFITSFNGMALGLFSTLIIGVIIGQIASVLNHISFLKNIGDGLTVLSSFLKSFMGLGIGIGMAVSLKLDGLKLVVAGIAGGIATKLYNDPMVAYISVCAVYFFFIYILKHKTPVDIIIVPFTGTIMAFLTSFLIGGTVADIMSALGKFIQISTELHPLLMGAVIAVVMGMALTAPISSAAIAISISLGGIAGGASVVGCSVQMLGFAIMSRKDNNIGTVISVAIGTSMLQFKNILKKPIIWLPTIIVSAILGPISTLLFKTKTSPIGSGMGTSGLVGQMATIEAMGSNVAAYLAILILQIILPLILVLIIDLIFRKKKWILPGDLKI